MTFLPRPAPTPRARRRGEDLGEQHEAVTRARMLRDGDQRAVDLRVAAEALGAVDEPEVELVLSPADFRRQLGVESLRVVDEVARVHLEEAREEHARRVRQVRAAAAL